MKSERIYKKMATDQEIFNQLFAGKKLDLEFSSLKEKEYLRVRLYILKRKQDAQFINVGLITPEEKEVLRSEKVKQFPGYAVFRFWLEKPQKQERKTFKIISESVAENRVTLTEDEVEIDGCFSSRKTLPEA